MRNTCRCSNKLCAGAYVVSFEHFVQANREVPARPIPAAEGDRTAPTCQVESCGRDLSHLSTYHQRCRICEIHIKESNFLRAGIMQRFCQQCGRCHPMDAFQGQKRSCVEQLAKHNARRCTFLSLLTLAQSYLALGASASSLHSNCSLSLVREKP